MTAEQEVRQRRGAIPVTPIIQTPWGPSEDLRRHGDGIYTVYANGRMALLLADSAAKRLLSDSARDRADRHATYYLFPWGVKWCIAAFELLDAFPDIGYEISNARIISPKDSKEFVLNMIAVRDSYYLRQRKIKPPAHAAEYHEMYSDWLDQKRP